MIDALISVDFVIELLVQDFVAHLTPNTMHM